MKINVIKSCQNFDCINEKLPESWKNKRPQKIKIWKKFEIFSRSKYFKFFILENYSKVIPMFSENQYNKKTRIKGLSCTYFTN